MMRVVDSRISPSELENRRLLCEEYLRQQLDLMGALIPKVRSRRAALRSTVSAIMGRNMSHNIGSHVLARYSSKIKDDLDKVVTTKADHRGDFLAYLQRRMDFLAEVATSDQAFWSQPLSLKEQLGRLNYEEQKGRFGTTPPNVDKSVSIILSNITGKESLRASVEYGKPDQMCSSGKDYWIGQEPDAIWFSCPGGEVGVHALYVILENIIRNSARHGAAGVAAGQDETVWVFANIIDESDNSKLLKLEIIDPRTKLECAWIDNLQRDINSILHDEPFLDASGNPNPQFWGVREMQICGHYLRGFSLSDMEGERDKKNPVLEAGVHTLPDNSFCLKYTLYLQRAKLMAAVVTDGGDPERTNKLRGRGIVLIESSKTKPDWPKIARAARGYGFLVVEDGIGISEDRDVRALLPVRRFNYCKSEIDARINEALSNRAWMEPLHRHWAEMCRDLRSKWKKLPLWGVAIGVQDTQLAPRADGNKISGGLFGTSRGVEQVLKMGQQTESIRPLPISEQSWHNSLRDAAVAAAWIDHPKPDDFINKARLNHAGEPNKETYHWVSAEGAFSDGAHTAYLKTCRPEEGWELLAAAVARVAVLDERVQSELVTMSHSGIKLSKAWPFMGVWVPAKDNYNLDNPVLAACNTFLKQPAERKDQFPVDFLVIHLTILERLAKEKNESLPDTLGALIKDTEAKNAEIIIVTGRGVPTVASALNKDHIENVRYLPISALLENLVSRPSKLALMRVIWSAGRPFDKNCIE
jgi:hypothetical protein